MERRTTTAIDTEIGVATMLETIKTIDGESLLPLSDDVLSSLGLAPGSQVRLTVVDNTLVIQAEEATDDDFVQTFQTILERRRPAYEELAEGAR